MAVSARVMHFSPAGVVVHSPRGVVISLILQQVAFMAVFAYALDFFVPSQSD